MSSIYNKYIEKSKRNFIWNLNVFKGLHAKQNMQFMYKYDKYIDEN